MTIEKIKVEDSQRILNIIRDGMNQVNLDFSIYSSDNCIKYFEYLLESKSEVTGYYFFGYYDNKELIGVAEWKDLGEIFFLKNISVDYKYRGMGIGRELIEYGTKYAKKINKKDITLDVDNCNLVALSWYTSLGFKNSYQSLYLLSKKQISELSIKKKNSKYIINDYPQSIEILKRFGFTFLKVTNLYNEEIYNIGIIGEKYYRFNEINMLKNDELLSLLISLDANKKILVVSNFNKDITKEEFDIKSITNTMTKLI